MPFPHMGSNIYIYTNIQYMWVGGYKHNMYVCVNEKQCVKSS